MADENVYTAEQLANLPAQKAYFVGTMRTSGLGAGVFYRIHTIKSKADAEFAELQTRFPQFDWQMVASAKMPAQIDKLFPAGSAPLIVAGSMAKGALGMIKTTYPQATVLTWN
ncbi:hypothetical protein [Lacticaseibacillus hulanensis]|uniref:hypothetical protein n=1 Tax=Lacticaseibacillus hulanensis TaxID=2493111 RepID=UPI000FD87896|nr:hypothetical protein [Lacticaseibacillus hulanensis]